MISHHWEEGEAKAEAEAEEALHQNEGSHGSSPHLFWGFCIKGCVPIPG